jgi:hypothetical protein
VNNLMLDLETWGKRPGCAIRSIGAVMFDPFSRAIGQQFYKNVTRKSCEEIGLHIDQSTVDWWNSPKMKKAQDSLLTGQVPLRDACVDFVKWAGRQNTAFMWCQGANFDGPIIEEAFRLLELQAPWKFHATRDTRTIYEAGGLGFGSLPKRVGTHHNALEDAIYQAGCVQAAYKNVRSASDAMAAQGGN